MVTIKQLLDQRAGEVWTVGPDDTVFDAIRLMSEKDIGSLPVMQNHELIGILSERDYTRKIVLKDRSSKSTKVSEIMTIHVITIGQQSSVDECMMLMSQHHIRHLPAVDGNGRVTGVISILDVLKSILSDKEFEIQQLANYIAGTA